MRFRARIDKESLLVLLGVTSTLEKISVTSAIFLNESCIRIAAVTENMDSPRCYSELKVNILFSEYRIESQSSNTILLELNMSHFTRALGSGKNSGICQIKLVKRGLKAFLCFEAKSVEGLSVDITHDIPIRVLKSSDIVYYIPPDVPPPSVSLEIPKHKLMRSIIDRMSRIAKQIDLTANQNGRLIFRVDHGSAIIKTFYNGLQPRFEGNLDPAVDSDNTASVRLDIRKLSLILNFNHLIYSRSILFMKDHCAVVIYVNLSPSGVGSVTFYCPVIAVEQNE